MIRGGLQKDGGADQGAGRDPSGHVQDSGLYVSAPSGYCIHTGAAADVPFSVRDSCMELLIVQITFPPYEIRCKKCIYKALSQSFMTL